ncbi:hypothetical protein PAMP_012893 [Pampus punctatissimus]
MHGYMLKLGNPFLTQWQRRYFYLFPNRVEWRGEGESRQNLLTMEQIVTVEETQIKDKKCILLRIKGGKQFVLQCESPSRKNNDEEKPLHECDAWSSSHTHTQTLALLYRGFRGGGGEEACFLAGGWAQESHSFQSHSQQALCASAGLCQCEHAELLLDV